MAFEFGLLLVISYLVGSIPMAYVVAKLYRGKDIRNYGSGQVGASNLFRSVSKPLGVAVGLYDLGKGAFLVWIAQLLDLTLLMQIIIGAAVVIGHNWPIFLRFNAGRGLATTVGICLFLLPWGLIPFIAIGLSTLVIGSSPLPMLLAVMSLPVASVLLQYFGRPQPLTLTLGLTFLVLLMIARRLTAPRTSKPGQVSTRDYLVNRLLFDRDIKDGKAWIHRQPGENLSTKGPDKIGK